MARNDQNLVPSSERTPEERKEIARKGGKASAAAKRRKKALKEYFVIPYYFHDFYHRRIQFFDGVSNLSDISEVTSFSTNKQNFFLENNK